MTKTERLKKYSGKTCGNAHYYQIIKTGWIEQTESDDDKKVSTSAFQKKELA
jgi:hypothetical protein